LDVRQRIIDLRIAVGVSTNKLAKIAGIGQSTLSDIESGKVKPSIDTLEKICISLGVSLAEFFTEEKKIANSRISRLNPEQRQALEKFLETL